MSPSRGLNCLHVRLVRASSRSATRRYSTWTEAVANPQNKVQSYISRSRDPYLNLSLEHHLLQKSSPDSTILFLYTNRPCVVIGRNQNPWLEVNLALLQAAKDSPGKPTEPPALGSVDLVRRRSGGGTVFHDEGNVNWSVICPPATFTRDKHAEMVVRALRALGVDRSRVNERHDIVLDQGVRKGAVDEEDTHRTPYTSEASSHEPRPLKVSGSAYKLTRTRALHHGTCLLSSPNLNIIPDYLHSPAKPYIKARGVESVSSPVGNIGIEIEAFKRSVQEHYQKMYHPTDANEHTSIVVGEEQLDVADIKKGYEELKVGLATMIIRAYLMQAQSLDWTFLQTPQFTFSSHPTEEDDRERPDLPVAARVYLKARFGAISESFVSWADSSSSAVDPSDRLRLDLQDQKLHEIHDWTAVVEKASGPQNARAGSALGAWLTRMFPRV
ncbi:hypothetical protein H2201_005427 [Coniosporium apollinis]|uniref:Putative lipoate-protein ligase A n=1 Tax=Coniosporium apollinis TaxID=61459 RepID=A0ABQ9NV63_9PEZI|nr:hypothetical protein H2201_005427 [Coniosporium apollinis]